MDEKPDINKLAEESAKKFNADVSDVTKDTIIEYFLDTKMIPKKDKYGNTIYVIKFKTRSFILTKELKEKISTKMFEFIATNGPRDKIILVPQKWVKKRKLSKYIPEPFMFWGNKMYFLDINNLVILENE